ncbi:MAG: hypothetical protein J7M08_04190 [Planctomycetes bacterium]|nr:hypothetical protein [Planctomycetota bacterium]
MKRLALLSVALLSVGGCAVLSAENRHLSKALAATCWPRAPVAKVATAPVFVPVWMVALVADAVVVNPALSVPRSFRGALDTCSLTSFLMPLDIIAYPLKLALSPPVFLGTELYYCMAPI